VQIVRAGRPNTSAFLTTLLGRPMPPDLQMLLVAWAAFEPGPIQIGSFAFRTFRPWAMDQIPYSWTHPIAGCDDLEVNGSRPGLIVGSLGAGDEEKGLFVSELDRFTSISTLPTLDESAERVAASLEEFLRSVA
jgi:hypothetical protein